MVATEMTAKPPTITPDLAEKLRNANLSNLVKKVKAGKTLTAAEMKQIEEASEAPDDPNISAIARTYGIARNTLMRWRDQGLDLADAAAVAAKVASSKAAAPTEDEKEAKLRKLRGEADMIEHKLAVQRGEYIRADEVKAEGVRIGLAVSIVFAKMPEDLPPLLAGRDSAEIKKLLTKWQREKRTELSLHEGPVKITT